MINNKPENLKECIEILDNTISESDKEKIKKMPMLDFVISQHFGMAMDIRNAWGLWDENSSLFEYFKKHLFYFHPDDISGDILRIFYNHLKGENIDFNNPIRAFYGEEFHEKYIKISEIEKLKISEEEKKEKKLEILFPDKKEKNRFKKIKKEFDL